MTDRPRTRYRDMPLPAQIVGVPIIAALLVAVVAVLILLGKGAVDLFWFAWRHL